MTGATLPSTARRRSKARQLSLKHQNETSSSLAVQAGPRIGTLLLLSVAGFSGLAAWGGQLLLNKQHQRLTPEVSQAKLWQHYRWAIDPQTRREAALLMVARDGAPQLLHGQGWGRDPMAAVVLERAASPLPPRASHRTLLRPGSACWIAFPKHPAPLGLDWRLATTIPFFISSCSNSNPHTPQH